MHAILIKKLAVFHTFPGLAFLQGVSVAASPVLATIGMSVCPSVRLSVCLSHPGTEKFIQKFERVHPERGR